MSADRLKTELDDLCKWWYYHRNDKMDPQQFVDFQNKFNHILVRLLADVVQLKLEEDQPKVILPKGLMLNDKLRAS